MKNLDRAIRVYRALVESPVRVDSSTICSWHTTEQALQHDPKLLTELREISEAARNRVLAYVGQFAPLTETRTMWQFPDHPAATRFKKEVEEAGGTATHMDGGGLVAAGTSDPLTCEHYAAQFGGAKVSIPSIYESFHAVDTGLPEALFINSGLDSEVCEQALIASIYKSASNLNESRLFAGFLTDNPIKKYEGRINAFCEPKTVLGVPARLAEAVRIAGMATPDMLSFMEAGGAGGGVSGGGSAPGGDPASDRGGVAKDQPDARQGAPANSRNGEQEPQTPPTEHVPSQEQGNATNSIRLPDGTEVPMDAMRSAFAKMLQNMATQVEQGTAGGQPAPRGMDQVDAEGTAPPTTSVAQQQVAQQTASQQVVGQEADSQAPGQTPSPDAAQVPGEAPPPQNGEAPPAEVTPVEHLLRKRGRLTAQTGRHDHIDTVEDGGLVARLEEGQRVAQVLADALLLLRSLEPSLVGLTQSDGNSLLLRLAALLHVLADLAADELASLLGHLGFTH